ncbi:MAG: hydrogenase maturation nickel metallochaperone HypA [Acidobacteria bacterium]|nr:hydrogenase maturation nickel metallochaperone HypA [Acidobacteriota bacterium]
MHEWSLALEIIRSAEKEAKERDAKEIEEVYLQLGSLNNIVVEQLIDAFEIAKERTMLKNSHFYVEIVNAVGYCNICKKDFQIEPPFLICPSCMGNDIRVEKGEELHLRKITLVF